MHNNQAFTLVETLISILILAVMLAGGLALYFNSSAIMARAMHKKMAMEMANQAMEESKRENYDSLSNYIDRKVKFDDFEVAISRSVVSYVDKNGISQSGMKVIEIKTEWLEYGRQDKTKINLVTYVSKK